MKEKDVCINELEKVLKYFYEAKTLDDKEQIKYFQGMSKGMIMVLKRLKVIEDEELQNLVKSAELEVPTVYREKIK